MNNNNRKRFNLYTQGQRLAVRGLFILGIFFGSVPAVLAQGFFEKVLAGALVLSGGFNGVNSLDLLNENDRGLLGGEGTTLGFARDMFSGFASLPEECQQALNSKYSFFEDLIIDIHNKANDKANDDLPCIDSLTIECEDTEYTDPNKDDKQTLKCDNPQDRQMIKGIYLGTIKRLLNEDCKEIFDLYKQGDLPTLYVQYLWNEEVESTLKIYPDPDEGNYVGYTDAYDANCQSEQSAAAPIVVGER